ncbi:hypothetical protein IPM62_05425 [Candidatus Woesebacteria bacterium]|nr:MAG: hypothetical protein IPM62_05425 [Candidatus Woesebacteria bacterium]
MNLRNIGILALLVIIAVGGLILWRKTNFSSSNQQANNSQNIEKKEYKVREGKVIVLGRQNKKEITAIDLSAKEGEFTIKFTPHNITLIPDKKQIWLTATAPEEQFQAISKESLEHIHLLMTSDQIFVVDTQTHNVAKRLNIGMQLGLTDLIISPDGKYAYTSAETGNAIYKINTSTYKVDLIQLPPESKPHQLALSAEGTKLYARNQTNNKMFLISISTNEVKNQNNNEETKSLRWSSH